MLIAIEGIDFSGKTTQATLLHSEVKGELLKFPRRENTLIMNYLKGEKPFCEEASFFIFLADIIDGIKRAERRVESKNELVVCDRYVYSTVAYSKIDVNNAKEIVKLSPLPKADLVVLLDLEMEEYKKRIGEELDSYEKNLNFIEKVRENYLEMAKEKFFAKEWMVISSSKGVEEIHLEIKKKINSLSQSI